VVAGFDDGTVRLWMLERRDDALTAAPGPITHLSDSPSVGAVAFSPDGRLVACGGANQNLYLVRAEDGAELASIATHNGTARTASFSPDGSKVAVAGYFRVQVYDVATRQPWTPAGASAFGFDGSLDAAFTRDGRYLLSTGRDATLHVWELADEPSVLTLVPSAGHAVRAVDVTTARGAIVLAAARGDGVVTVHTRGARAPTDEWHERLRLRTGPATALAILPGGEQLVVGCQDGRIHTFDANSGREIQELAAHDGRVNDLRFTPDGTALISCGTDGMIRWWRRRADAGSASWQAAAAQQREREVLGMAISRDGTRLLTTERNRSIALWSVADARLIGLLDSEVALWKPGLSPDGRWISVGLWDRSIQMWSAPQLGASVEDVTAMRRTASLIGHTQLVSAQVFDQGGGLMASTSADGQVKIWDIVSLADDRGDVTQPTRRCLATLTPRGGEAYAAAFLPPPLTHQLAVGYRDGSVRLWDLRYYDRHIDGQVEYQRRLRGTRN
jgi:WD40 repeat protein